LRNDIVDPGETVGCGIAADSLVVDPVRITVLIQYVLQILRVTSTGNAGCQTIAESDDHRPIVYRGRSGGARHFRTGLFRFA
jgi:hypothetical protein